MHPESIPLPAFEAMVVDALDSLPDWVIPIVAKIVVLVEDDQPLDERRPASCSSASTADPPDDSLRACARHPSRHDHALPQPILAVCEHPEDVAPRVRKVLVHEVGTPWASKRTSSGRWAGTRPVGRVTLPG